ncbi:hypothetical protein [Nocardioides sp. AE5]|uniref:hypothetical protein n=1 Tax=Nocardioides sp. AE5 TaxID=2962573 RepID=UPI002880ED5E|nr:hypothetical protein [Nocardioides sp. AE5]MDT0202802.1 hypothetical protein [Nocardioides sp. AE5]
MIQIDPIAVGAMGRAWVQQQEQLGEGCALLASLPMAGFSERVTPAARAFTEDWTSNVDGFAAESASIGERLGSVVTTYVETEQVVEDRFCTLDLNGDGR